jgi:hypothetical protein
VSASGDCGAPGASPRPLTSRIASAVLLSFVMLHGACQGKAPVEKIDAGTAPPGRLVMRIAFSLPGDDLGSPEYAYLLDRIRAGIVSRGAGEILSSGFGMGSMEIVVSVEGEKSEQIMAGIIAETYPAARYRIEKTGR